MKKEKNRKLIQLYAALLYNAHLKGYIEGDIYTGNIKAICVPGLNCYSCPGAIGACPLGALQNALASSGNRAPYYVLGILLVFAVTFGRTICGWLCPAGLVQELVYKIPTPKLVKNRITHVFSYLKYIILIIFVIAIPLWYSIQKLPLPAFCKYICPAGTLGGAVQLLAHPTNADKFPMLGALFTKKWIILILLLCMSVFIYRVFCRFLCPLGAIYSLFNRFSLIGICVNQDKCTNCGQCTASCSMDTKMAGDHECIQCGKCINECNHNAITFQAGKYVIMGGEEAKENTEKIKRITKREKTIAASIMAALLCVALVFSNFLPMQKEPAVPANTSYGHEKGQQAVDFTLATVDGKSFHLKEYRGKVVVLNLWATWCTPCVNELPYFEKLHRAHPDDVVVLAIHSDLVTDDVQEYLSGYSYTFPFAVDEDGKTIASLGGSTMLPQTIILDKDGVVTYNQVGSVTYEMLETLVKAAYN